MKTKKCGSYAAAAVVVLITALLVTGCLDIIDPSGLSLNNQNNSNKGILIINLGGGGRTIMPTGGLEMFDEFKVTVLDEENGDAIVDDYDEEVVTFIASSGIGTINLEAGEYTVIVEAFINNVLAATGEATGVTVTTTGTADITLKEIDNAGNGTFAWTFNLTQLEEYTTATITIANHGGGSQAIPTIQNNLLAVEGDDPPEPIGFEGSATLISGYYRVTVTLAKARHQTRTLTEILHIYAGMTSSYAPTLPALVQNNFDVTFNPNGGANTGALLTNNILEINWNTTITAQPVPANSGKIFDGWWDAATGGNEWTFGVGGDRVYNTTILYARWSDLPPVTVTLEFDLANLGELITLDLGTTIIHLDELDAGGIRVDLLDESATPLDTLWTASTWSYFNGTAWITVGTDLDYLEIDDSIINPETGNLIHEFEVLLRIDGKDYNISFIIELDPTPSP
ncbi:MAG: InlB B-repeat-containing protein [Treponema sp.]|nr:InlB B-repeat-containing protein [Treponema sp.]